MKVTPVLRTLALAAILCCSSVCASPAPPAPQGHQAPNPEVAKIQKQLRELDRATEQVHTRAVVKIQRPEGVCYWQIMGADALARISVKDSGFGALLLSAKVGKNHEVEVSVAGENQPLETTSLGRFKVSLRSDEKGEKDREDPQVRIGDHGAWKLSLISPSEFFTSGIDGCCSCTLYKLTCCPSAGHCLGCGTCGDCCGD